MADSAGKTTLLDAPASTRHRGLFNRPRTWRDFVDPRAIARRMTRDHVIGFLKSMLWVVPLTLLIWIYAERAQVVEVDASTVRVQVTTAARDRVVSLGSADSRLTLSLKGPRAQVAQVVDQLSKEPLPLDIDGHIDPNLSGPQSISAKAILAGNPFFTDQGVSVESAAPAWLEVTVDKFIEPYVPVVAPESVNSIASVTFHPPEVQIRGPRRVIEEFGEISAVASIGHLEELRTPGTKQVDAVSVELPEALRAAGVTFANTPRVDATLVVRDREVTLQVPSLPILQGGPDGLFDDYTLVYENSIPNVSLIGPKDQIDALRAQLQQGGDAPMPYGLLVVKREDIGTGRRKRLVFENLPPGVRVSDEDRRREINFDLVPRPEADGGLN